MSFSTLLSDPANFEEKREFFSWQVVSNPVLAGDPPNIHIIVGVDAKHFQGFNIHRIMNDLPERGRICRLGITDTFTRLGVTNGKDILDAQIINMYDRSNEWTDAAICYLAQIFSLVHACLYDVITEQRFQI